MDHAKLEDGFIFPQSATVFINAWKKHDAKASRLSTTAEIELRNGRGVFHGTSALKMETDRLVDSLGDLADDLGISPVHLMRALQELRRDGVAHAKAVRLVIQYLEELSV